MVAWGCRSLAASPLKIDALVLESVYPTITEAVRNRISLRLGPLTDILTPALLIQLKPRLQIDPSQLCPIDNIHDAGCPVLIAAGDCDRHTTLPETMRLFQAANNPKQLVVFEGAAHQDLLAFDPGRYDKVLDFLNLHLTGNNSERPLRTE